MKDTGAHCGGHDFVITVFSSKTYLESIPDSVDALVLEYLTSIIKAAEESVVFAAMLFD